MGGGQNFFANVINNIFRAQLNVCDTMAEDEDETKFETFASFSYLLSPLILRALADLGFSRPTLVQQKAIPLALENRDVLARARTGSGKTAAYSIPLVQKILNAKAVGTLRGDRLVPIFPHNPPSFFFSFYRTPPSRTIRARARER